MSPLKTIPSTSLIFTVWNLYKSTYLNTLDCCLQPLSSTNLPKRNSPFRILVPLQGLRPLQPALPCLAISIR